MRSIKVMLFILISFAFISCEEDFNPYGDYFERFAFTCVLKSDQNYQTATLFRSYRPDGSDPSTYTEDPSVIGADIRVLYNDSVFVFRDSSEARVDTSRYKTPLSFYYNDKFIVGNRKTIELEVLLPNGKRFGGSFTGSGQVLWIVFDAIGAPGDSSPLEFVQADMNEVPQPHTDGTLRIVSSGVVISVPDDASGIPGGSVGVLVRVDSGASQDTFDLTVQIDPAVAQQAGLL